MEKNKIKKNTKGQKKIYDLVLFITKNYYTFLLPILVLLGLDHLTPTNDIKMIIANISIATLVFIALNAYPTIKLIISCRSILSECQIDK